MEFSIVPVTPFQQNCSLLVCEQTRKGAIVDPGGEIDRLLEHAESRCDGIEKILLTHAHLDHASGTAELARRLGVPIEGPHVEDQFWIDLLPQQAAQYGFPPAETFTPDRWFVDEETVTVGETELKVRHCPGHTPGHVVFFEPESKVVIVGDVLFAGSIGRTDFPRGDYDTLIRSIQERLLPMGDEVTFVPGHGPTSTLGEERRTNPFLVDPERYRGMA
ncbi:MAG: MBL fold metallo-hydrolase [Planctomycetes bacterium]|nr:MBL fold metallo-hydrolase [Planctomycetota bacterium]